MLKRGVTPVVPAQGSVGASGDLAPLAHMAAAMIGVGEAYLDGERMPAADALGARGPRAGRRSAPKEGLALLNGTQFSTAYALGRPVRGRARCFSPRWSTGALSTDAARGSDAPFDPRIHALRRHRGQIDVADCLARADGGQRDPRLAPARRPARAGPLLPALPAAGDGRLPRPACARRRATLDDEANGVSDNPLIFAEDDAALSGGNFHAEPVAFAADMIALAICEIGSLAERRVAMLVDPALSGLPAFLTPQPGLNSGFMIAQVTAAALVSENKQRAYPASVDSIPTSANQEDHVSMAAHGARRLIAMARNAASVVAHRSARRRAGLRFPRAAAPRARRSKACARAIRGAVPQLDDDRYLPRRHRGGGAARRCSGDAGRGGGRDPLGPPLEDERDESRLAHRRAPRRAADRQHSARRDRAVRATSRASSAPGWRAATPTGICPQLYDFAAELGATIVRTALSRSIIDVNRDPSGASLYPGQATTELCPTTTFDGEPLYRAGEAPDEAEIAERRRLYFAPYHDALSRGDRAARAPVHGRVVLYDAHSIRSRIPRLFDGELPAFNLGTNAGASCDPALRERSPAVLAASGETLCRRRPLQGRLDHARLWAPERGRPRRADGARLPRLHGRARTHRRDELADRRSTPAAPSRPARR